MINCLSLSMPLIYIVTPMCLSNTPHAFRLVLTTPTTPLLNTLLPVFPITSYAFILGKCFKVVTMLLLTYNHLDSLLYMMSTKSARYMFASKRMATLYFVRNEKNKRCMQVTFHSIIIFPHPLSKFS